MAGPDRETAPLAEVAHELNNPAAAVRRGVALLTGTRDELRRLERRIGALGLDDADLAPLESLARAAARAPNRIDPVDRSDAETALEAWLGDRGLSDPADLAPVLVEIGYDVADVERLASRLGGGLETALQWLTATHELHLLLAEIEQGATRIGEIARGLVAYSVSDREPVDIHQGLEGALKLLRGKLTSVAVRREYAADLPDVEGHGSELERVWTNLLDNALHALDGHGTLTVRTRSSDGWVEVEVEDDGPGVPEEIQDRIFEAFFTTKPPGAGTGLGLDISRYIVQRHGGELTCTSGPDGTTFTTRLPVAPAR